VRNRHCRVIIDRDSNRNIASLELIEKLDLTTQPHPCPYNIQSVNSCDNIVVDKIARIEFFIGTYKDSAEFDIIPMQICHLLFGQSWNDINNVLHNTVANKCSFKYNGRKITLIAMTATEILEVILKEQREERMSLLEKNGLFQMLQCLPPNLILYKMKISLCLLLELIFCSIYPKKKTRCQRMNR